MIQSAEIMLGNKTISVWGNSFPLGKLICDFINQNYNFDKIFKLREQLETEIKKLTICPSNEQWYAINTIYVMLECELRGSVLEKLLKDDWNNIYKQTADFTAVVKFGSNEELNPFPLEFYTSVTVGGLATKWEFYKNYIFDYSDMIMDVYSFKTAMAMWA